MWDNIRKRFRSWASQKRAVAWITAVGFVGILLVGISAWSDNGPTPTQMPVTDTQTYIAQLEERLSKMVSSIRGAGRAQVMITLQNGVEYIYANEEKTNSDHTESDSQVSVRDDNQKTVVTVDDGNGKSGLLVTEIQPVVRGVVVTCEGATDEAVTALVSQAVCTALDITGKRVCVVPFNS
ncbi:MAG: hypothetical protein E7553_01005 [Ruminococcaceae bacterium]|nr:hypothetical protein [Oscillospiraceae bacterium]